MAQPAESHFRVATNIRGVDYDPRPPQMLSHVLKHPCLPGETCLSQRHVREHFEIAFDHKSRLTDQEYMHELIEPGS